MLVYSKYPKCGINIGPYFIFGYLQSDPVNVPWKIWHFNRDKLILGVYNHRIIKKIYGVEVPPASFTYHTIENLPYNILVKYQQALKFPLEYGRALENYHQSLKDFLRNT
jgi:hypothetical protein